MDTKQSDDQKFKGLIEEIRGEFTTYFETRLKLLKLEASEKGSIFGALFIFGLILAFFSLLAIVFVLITLSIWIGMLMKSPIAGFAIVTGTIILVLFILLLCAKPLRLKITNTILSIIAKAVKE